MGLQTIEKPPVPALRREVGPLGLLCVSLGTIIGSAWLFAAAATTSLTGPASLVSWVLAGMVVSVLGLQLAELGAAYPLSGGLARFPQLALGPIAGFATGWILWLALTVGVPFEAQVALFYLGNEVDGLVSVSDGTPVLTGAGIVAAIALLAVFFGINALGVRRFAATNTALVWLKVAVPVLITVAIIAAAFHPSNFTSGEFAPAGVRGIVAALPAGVILSFLGFEQAIQLAGEARNPGRDLPRAVLGAIGLAMLLYMALQVAFIGAIGATTVQANAYGPFAALAVGLGLGWLAVIVYGAAFASPAGCGLVVSASSARAGYALSQNGYLPPLFERLDGRGLPRAAMVLSFLVGVLVLLPFPGWQQLVALISAGAALYFAFIPVCFAALRRSDPHRVRPYRAGGGQVLAPAGFVAASLIFYWAGWKADRTVLLALLAGVPLLLLSGRMRAAADRPRLTREAWRAAAWLPPFYLGMAVFSYLGEFGGRGVIPFWWDAALITVFALVVFRFAVLCALPADQVAANLRKARLPATTPVAPPPR